MSQGKRAYNMHTAVGQSALMATRRMLSINDFIGMSLPYRLPPNRKEKNLKLFKIRDTGD
jgi:hypothetical protein